MTTSVNYLHEDDEHLLEELEEILCTIFPNKRVCKAFHPIMCIVVGRT